MIDLWLEQIGQAIGQNLWLAPVLALLAGILTSVTPCALSSVPLVIAYVGGRDVAPGKAVRLSLVFALGSALVFTALGVTAASVGYLIGVGAKWWYLVLGALMVLMALQTWEVLRLIPSTYLTGKSKRRGYIGALLTGMLGGLFSSPCATPVLVALLAIAAGSGNLFRGALLLLLYGVGHGALAVLAGSSVGAVSRIAQSGRYGALSRGLKIVLGAAILLIGLYLFYLGF
ncbi:MAG: sulfite exporter TauE/SafE family protein [Eubacteriales bacterium]|nr:sulfite exporter TauE/SafE family protein [Eubacteriales bacterium]